MLAPHEEPRDAEHHERAHARFRRVRCNRGGDAQIAADDVHAEGVAEEGIVAMLAAVRRALRRERVDIGQGVTCVQNTESDVSRHGTDGPTRVEVVVVEGQRIEQWSDRPDDFQVTEVGEIAGTQEQLGFEFAQAKLETAALGEGAVGMGDHRVHPGTDLGGFGATGAGTMRSHTEQPHLKVRYVKVQRDVDRGSAIVDEGLGPQRLPHQLCDDVLGRRTGIAENQLAHTDAAIAVRFRE